MKQGPIAATVVFACSVALLSGCGGSKKSSSAVEVSSARIESSSEAVWRQDAQQFAHELDTGLQALATTASTDAYAAVSNLGPLAYCSNNLDALGAPPPVYELAQGSFAAACEELSSGARLWQSEVNSNGQSFQAAAYAIRRGRRLLTRGEDRLVSFQTDQPPLQGTEARRAQEWARAIDKQWTSDIERAFASVDREIAAGAANPIQALWEEHSGGDAGTVSSCTDILDRYVTTPSTASATRALARLHNACAALEGATNIDSFDGGGYEVAKSQMRSAIANLRRLAP